MPGFIMFDSGPSRVLGRDLQVAAGVVLRELLDPLGRFDREVVAHAGGDQDLLDARQRARLAIELDQRRVIGAEVLAHLGVDARRQSARGLDLAALAGDAVHVGGRAAQVADDAGEARAVSRMTSISRRIEPSERLWMMRPSCSVIEQKLQPPKQPRMDRDRELDHLVRGDLGLAVARMRLALERQLVQRIHFFGVVSGIGGGLIHTSIVPCRCTSARALCGLASRCRMREACA
jgi:hypothetical protein